MKMVGANALCPVSPSDELLGKVNYFIGSDPKKWHTNIATYRKVAYRGLYKGVDLVYYGNGRQVEYDFIVRPGGDPSRIALSFTGAKKMRVAASGDLVLTLSGGEVIWRKPVVYQQEPNGARRPIAGGYAIASGGAVRFAVAKHDASRPLVIDPALAYSTYLGEGAFEYGNGIAVDGFGDAYICGSTSSPSFPVSKTRCSTSRNSSLILYENLMNSVFEMEEYKKSLIHHVVTGKVDVRGLIV